MSFHPDVIRVYTIIDIDIGLIHAAKNECDGLNLNTTASSKIFQPEDKCVEIIDAVKKHVSVFCVRENKH